MAGRGGGRSLLGAALVAVIAIGALLSGVAIDSSVARFGRLSIRRGRNAWRLLITSRYGDRSHVLQLAAQATAKLLWQTGAQPLSGAVFYPWGDGPGAHCIGAGDARPIVPVEAVFGGVDAAPGIDNGELIGIRSTFLPAPPGVEPIPVSMGEPTGGLPCWWVIVHFWWRGSDVEVATWPLLSKDGAPWAILDVAVDPLSDNPTPDKSPGEVATEIGGKFVEQSVNDWDRLVSWSGRSGALLLTGGVLAVLLGALLRAKR